MVTLAEASAEAIKRVTAAIGDQEAPMRYMLGEKYIAAMGRLADSPNAKTILLPADIQETLRGLLGRRA
jgi:regulator of protease activity HflC (stomatin/prohibitin superfamily)